jgi:hypothetical protein
MVLVVVAACGRYRFDERGDAAADLGDAPHDIASDGAPVCLASYHICDGFESGISASWTTTAAGISLDTTVAHRGSASVHAHVDAIAVGVNDYATIFDTQVLGLGEPMVYVRAYVMVSALPATNNRMELISATRSSSGGDYLFLHDIELAVYSQYSTAIMKNGSPPATNTWLCMLWTVGRSTAATGTIALAGDPPPASVTTQTDGSPPINDLAFGIGYSGTNVNTAQPAMDVWIDDIIESPSPVTCAD